MNRRKSWMRLSTVVIVAALGSAGVPQKVPAQGQVSVTGTVRDSTRAVLPGVTVTALNTASGRQATVVSGPEGTYEFRELAPGPYRITAELPGFSAEGRSVDVRAGETLTLDFTMALGALQESITVTASRGERVTYELPQPITLVRSDLLDVRRPAGIQEALERTPNMRTIETNPYRARPQLRGLASSRVAIMVDGERLNNTRVDVGATGMTPGFVDPRQVESIEVVAGAGSSLYGSDAVAGTINIITKSPRHPERGFTVDARADVDYDTNSDFIKGGLQINLGAQKFAFRTNYSQFSLNNYSVGGEAIPKEEVVRLGNFIVDVGKVTGTNLAQSFGVWDLPAGGESTNNIGRGFNSMNDLWFFVSTNQTLRIKYLRTRYRDLGLPFADLPWQPLRQVNFFSNLDKISLRWDMSNAATWLPQMSVRFYHQYYKKPQNDLRFEIIPGSSYAVGADGKPYLTGNVSQYRTGLNNFTENRIKSYGVEAQINFIPWRRSLYTTGMTYLRDESRDVFTRQTAGTGGTVITTTGLKTVPDNDYWNVGWFNQFEWTPIQYLRFSGGFRLDKWKTRAFSSKGFPAGNEGYLLTTGLPYIKANPGPVNVAGVEGIDKLVTGTGELTTDRNVGTGNVGVSLLLPIGVYPYVRYGTSYREPEATVRYIIRNFGSPVFSIPSLPNTEIMAERGRNLDVGFKLERRQFRGAIGYFKNDIANYSQTIYAPTYCIPPNPTLGVLPTPFPPCSFTGSHAVLFWQRISRVPKAHFSGWEFSGEGAIPLGSMGSITPFATFSYLKSIDDAPSANDLKLFDAFNGRSDIPIKIDMKRDEIPASDIVPFQGSVAARYTNRSGRFWGEYEFRFANEITKLDLENTLATPNYTQYGTIRSLEGFKKSTIRGGYRLTQGQYPVSFTIAVENVNNALFFLPFQNAVAPGRSVIFGLTFEWRDLFNSERKP